jgi:hypothetical protein
MSACKKSFLFTLGIAVFFSFAILSNLLSDEGQTSILWSMPIGIILGVTSCLYLAKAYNPETKNPNAQSTSTKWPWGAALGILTANFISRFLGPVIAVFVFECTGFWLLITMSYLTIYHCRSEKSTTSD